MERPRQRDGRTGERSERAAPGDRPVERGCRDGDVDERPAPSSAAVKKPMADDATRSVLRVALRTLTLLPFITSACASTSVIAALTMEMRVPGGIELDSLRDDPRKRVRDRHVRRVPQVDGRHDGVAEDDKQHVAACPLCCSP